MMGGPDPGMMPLVPLLQPLASGHGARQPMGNASGEGIRVATASPRPPAASSSSSSAAAAGRATIRRRGQLVLEGLSTPRVAARARVDSVAVLGAHVALSISIGDASVSSSRNAEDGRTTAVLGFAGLDASADADKVGPMSHGSGRRRARGERGVGLVASEEEQRRFLADLARGQLSRLPGLLLGEPTRARTLGLHFFLHGSASSASAAQQLSQPEEAGPEPRLLAMQADGLVRLWALRGRQWPAWVPLTSFLLPFRHRPLPGMMTFDGASRRLVYVEAVAPGAAAGAAAPPGAVVNGAGASGGPNKEQLRVVSREVVFTPVPGADRRHGDGNKGEEQGEEVVTVGCAVPVAHVAEAAELEAVQAGSRGCWIVTAGRVGYNCFRTKRLVWMKRRQRQKEGATRRRRAFFALHAITEQLLALDPGEDGGAISVYTAPGNGTPLTRRVLHRGLLSCWGDPIAPKDVEGFAVHRNLALVSLPGRAQLAVFHLRTGDAWCRCPLPPPSPSQGGGAGGEQGPPRFWLDRSGATALGVWWPERSNALLRLAHLAAAKEQAFLASRGLSGLVAASRLCGEHGPSMAHALSHRALDAAHAAITTPAPPYIEAAAAPPEGGPEGSDEDGNENEAQRGGGRKEAVASAGPTPMAEIPLVLRAGLVMTAGGDTTEGAGGGRGDRDGVAVRSLAHDLRAALRDTDEMRREAGVLAAAPVPRSEKGDRREALAALAKRLRAAEDGQCHRVTPLLLAAEPLLRMWLEQQERGGNGPGLEDEAGEGNLGKSQQVKDAPIASAVNLAYAVCRAADDRGALAAAWARVLADGGADGAEVEAEAEDDEESVLRPLLLYCCALGDDGFLEALAPLLFRLQPARLVHLVARLVEPDLQPLSFQPLGAAGDDAPRPSRYDFYYRAPFLALPAPPAPPPKASGGPNPFDDDDEEEEEEEEEEEDDDDDDDKEHGPGNGGEAQGGGWVDGGAGNDEYEAQLQVSRAVYARALRLFEPLLADGPVGGEEGQDAGEREAAYRALLEGAGRFVCLAHRLILHSQQRRGKEDGWTAAMGLLDRLRTAACVRAHHQVFAFLLGQALASSDLGRVEAVMARRPPAFSVADVGALARRLRQDGEAVAVGSLKRCLSLVLDG